VYFMVLSYFHFSPLTHIYLLERKTQRGVR
jgi:hypothetical protein